MQTYFAFVASLLAATPVLAIIDVTIYDGVSGQGASKELQLTPGGCTTEFATYGERQAFICFLDDAFENRVNSIKCWPN
ncbi:hypothetical protein FOXYS1_3219 [Fusarium oxysporum]|uniref:Uncharacterized protein n=1 Tax=Fusarium oxysporum TaxID=5507 RepID=A0A8H5AIR1_FUSOX|nr:hypothetical protein FOXYS1_3219 [Fusarium oxysporum]